MGSSFCSWWTSIHESFGLTGLVKLFVIGLNQNSNEKSQDIVKRNEYVNTSKFNENLNYLYPNGHRITHQMRWFKGSRNRGLNSDKAA